MFFLIFMQTDPTFAERALTSLGGVKRFGMVAPMLSKTTKIALCQVLATVEAAGTNTEELRRKWGVKA